MRWGLSLVGDAISVGLIQGWCSVYSLLVAARAPSFSNDDCLSIE